jgi:putative holliday junction resolvase
VRLLGLDIGERRIGVAVSDEKRRIATPLKVLDGSALANPAPLRTIAEDFEVDGLVIGLPLSLDGSEGPQAARVREVGRRLSEALGLPVAYVDERLSSVQASRAMQDAGVSSKGQRGRLDMVAAALLLQGYLDSMRSDAEDANDATGAEEAK